MVTYRLSLVLLLGALVIPGLCENNDGTYEAGVTPKFLDVKPEEAYIPEELVEEEVVSREKRQLQGAGKDAMDRSLTRNPVGKPEFKGPSFHGGSFQDPKNFNGRVGGSVGAKVWEGRGQSVGVGLGGRVNTGLSNGRPFASKPQIGAGVGYQKGPFSASVGVQRGYNSPSQRRPSTSYGAGINYRFKRQISGPVSAAMDKSLTNNPVGKPDYDVSAFQGGGKSPKNFDGGFAGSVGTKVWEKNGHSVGVGLGGQAAAGMRNGRPYSSQSEIGVGLGYQKGPYSVSVGAGRNQNPFKPSNNYGIRFGYRFRRSALDDDYHINGETVSEEDHEELE